MRAGRSWALARADGSIQTGVLAANPFEAIPVLRFVGGLAISLATAIRGGRGRRRARASQPAGRGGRRRRDGWRLVITAVVVSVGGMFWPLLGFGTGAASGACAMVASLILFRVLTPRGLWRYHGAEHKAVAAFEAGVDLGDLSAVGRCSRVHNRCGTNVAFLVMVASLVLLRLPVVAQIPLIVLLLALSAEVVTWAAGRPGETLPRLLLAGGRFTQRAITTADPSPAQLAVACRALTACLEGQAALDTATLAWVPGAAIEPAAQPAA